MKRQVWKERRSRKEGRKDGWEVKKGGWRIRWGGWMEGRKEGGNNGIPYDKAGFSMIRWDKKTGYEDRNR
jgi:hypothetical protein